MLNRFTLMTNTLFLMVLAPAASAQPKIQWTKISKLDGSDRLTTQPTSKGIAPKLGMGDTVAIQGLGDSPILEVRVSNTVVFEGVCAHACPYNAGDAIKIPFKAFSGTGGEADVEVKVKAGATESVGYFVLHKRWELTSMQSPILFSFKNRIGQWRLGEDIAPSLSPVGVRVYLHSLGILKYVTLGTLLQTARADAESGLAVKIGGYVDVAGFLQIAHMPAQHGERPRVLLGLRPELLKKMVPEGPK
ncbi:MAG: hypothetical protein IBJ03_08530 [Gemmatimonadaceae bacterium]|nr:hypothetical protein [Gemmatimonadaceae bacterium]